VRVATATHCPVEAVLRAPYARTRWTFLHLDQAERLDELRDRGRAINQAGLMSLAVNEPRRLQDEHRRLLADLGQIPTPAAALKRAEGIITAVAALDLAEGRTKGGTA
jgi:hypothetical protein